MSPWELASFRPDDTEWNERLARVADRLRDAVATLGAGSEWQGVPDFNFTAYDFVARQPVDNHKWKEPDAAAACAWILCNAYAKWGDPRDLAAADAALRFLESLPYADNPYYEVLLPYGALAAARLNAEQDRKYDLHKLLAWCFGPSRARYGWGITADGPDGRWGGYDCHGLAGSIVHAGGYAFAMNTFVSAAALAPIVRYDDRYARALGKWILNLSNSVRLFYRRHGVQDWRAEPRYERDDAGFHGGECFWRHRNLA